MTTYWMRKNCVCAICAPIGHNDNWVSSIVVIHHMDVPLRLVRRRRRTQRLGRNKSFIVVRGGGNSYVRCKECGVRRQHVGGNFGDRVRRMLKDRAFAGSDWPASTRGLGRKPWGHDAGEIKVFASWSRTPDERR